MIVRSTVVLTYSEDVPKYCSTVVRSTEVSENYSKSVSVRVLAYLGIRHHQIIVICHDRHNISDVRRHSATFLLETGSPRSPSFKTVLLAVKRKLTKYQWPRLSFLIFLAFRATSPQLLPDQSIMHHPSMTLSNYDFGEASTDDAWYLLDCALLQY
jgi:hypothetical protein